MQKEDKTFSPADLPIIKESHFYDSIRPPEIVQALHEAAIEGKTPAKIS